jgi:hypothetical protein
VLVWLLLLLLLLLLVLLLWLCAKQIFKRVLFFLGGVGEQDKAARQGQRGLQAVRCVRVEL